VERGRDPDGRGRGGRGWPNRHRHDEPGAGVVGRRARRRVRGGGRVLRAGSGGAAARSDLRLRGRGGHHRGREGGGRRPDPGRESTRLPLGRRDPVRRRPPKKRTSDGHGGLQERGARPLGPGRRPRGFLPV
ncbi:MAG: Ornithine cyclodeaminase-like protein, partial [uncultured Rubrobacteraceae bacterium]